MTHVASYSVGVEFVSGSFTEIVADVRGVSINRRAGNLFQPLSAGQMTAILDNMDGRYSPRNTSSPYTGLIRPDLQVRVRATFGGSTYNLFRGFIDTWTVKPALPGTRTAGFNARDRLKQLDDRTVTTSLIVATKINSFLKHMFDVASVTTATYSVDMITDESPFAWFRDRDLLGALQEVLGAGFYSSYVAPDGILRVRSRYWDQIANPVASLLATATQTRGFWEMGYSLSDRDVLNDIKIEGVPRVRDSDTRTIAFLVDVPTIAASTGLGFFLTYLDPDNLEPAPADNVVTPVRSLDYKANDAEDGSGTDRTSTMTLRAAKFGETIVLSFYNGFGATVYLTRCVVRGRSVQRRAQINVRLQQASSQAVYGRRAFAMVNDLIAERIYLQDYAEFLRLRQSDPVDRLEPFGIKNEFPFVLARELGDVVHIQETNTGIAKMFTIMGIDHDIRGDGAGLEHTVQYECEAHHDFEVLVLDDPVRGKLTSGRKLGF